MNVLLFSSVAFVINGRHLKVFYTVSEKKEIKLLVLSFPISENNKLLYKFCNGNILDNTTVDVRCK